MTALLLALVVGSHASSPVSITVDASKTITPVSPSLYGIFFEEINQAGEGGLYAEMIRNRGMEGPLKDGLPEGWVAEPNVGKGTVTMDDDSLNAAHRRSLKISGQAGVGVANIGFWGINVRDRNSYKLTMWVKGDVPCNIVLSGGTLAIYDQFTPKKTEWSKFETRLDALGVDPRATFHITLGKSGTVRIAFASLTPVDTWKHRPNGMRMDLATHVADMNPKFVRFPGGCYVEGGDRLSDAFDWKRSVEKPIERRGLERSMWGYPNSFGLGYHEYLQWCEDLGAVPLFVVNCGMCHKEITPMSEMQHWVQETLDAIEYANGPVTSKWGAVRAKNGHPKSFGLKYIEIGNENGANWSFGGPRPYAERYKLIFDAIKRTHPEIVTIADNPVPHPVEILDEHYYADPAFFWRNTSRYDHYDRKGPRIYVGEYAVTQGCGQGNLAAALGEAAFMTGMERNSDVVTMSSYAPLFVNVNNRQWNPNAIVFDSSRSYGTPSYWVQSLFANNRADRIVKQAITASLSPPPAIGGTVGLETWRTSAEFRNIEVEADGQRVYPREGLLRSLLLNPQGDWKESNGIITQTDLGERRVALVNGIDLAGVKRYTMKLQARKTRGAEGFIFVLDAKDGTSLNWNLGGWNNTQTAFQRNDAVLGRPIQGRLIEENRWYDIRIERDGNRTRAFLDGKLIQEFVEEGQPDFAAVVGIDDHRHELVIKAVNGSSSARTADLNIQGVKLGVGGRSIVLTGPSLDSENSFENPRKIAPVETKLNGHGQYTLAAMSVTVVRIPISR